MARKLPIAASIFTLTTVLAFGISTPAHAEPSILFEFETTVDATAVGGSVVTPLRILYSYDLALAPGTGPFGSSGDGTYESYGPLRMFIVEVGKECASMSGDGTGATVFNNAGPDEDSIDVRAAGAAVAGKKLFGLDVNLVRFLLADFQGTMFDSTALPASPSYADASDVQQTVVEFIDANHVRTRLDPGDAPYQLSTFDPVQTISALHDDVLESQVSEKIKAKLVAPLEEAAALLGGALTQKNVAKARGALEDFIKVVHTNRKQLGQMVADSLTFSAQLIRDDLPLCA